MSNKCSSCGLKSMGDEGWRECKDCGKIYCPECAGKMHEEDRDIQLLRDGDDITRMQVLCPSCSVDMMPL